MRVTSAELVGHLWPNGEDGIGRVRETSQHPADGAFFVPTVVPVGGVEICDSLDFIEARVGVGPDSDLDLTNHPKNHRKINGLGDTRAERGSKGLTRYGARMLRSGTYLIDRDSPYGCLTFATFTLPDMPDEHRELILSEWGSITRTFFQRISRILVRRGCPGHIAYVTEVHPKRLERTGKVWPHIHAVFQGKRQSNEKEWAFKCKDLGKIWSDVVSTRVPDSVGYWGKSHWNVQRVWKSTSSYMAKYMSKGCSGGDMKKDEVYLRNPIKSWWGCVGGLKKYIIQSKKYLNTYECLMVMTTFHGESGEDDFFWGKDVNIVTREGHSIWVGWAGKLKAGFHAEVVEYHEASMLAKNPV